MHVFGSVYMLGQMVAWRPPSFWKMNVLCPKHLRVSFIGTDGHVVFLIYQSGHNVNPNELKNSYILDLVLMGILTKNGDNDYKHRMFFFQLHECIYNQFHRIMRVDLEEYSFDFTWIHYTREMTHNDIRI